MDTSFSQLKRAWSELFVPLIPVMVVGFLEVMALAYFIGITLLVVLGELALAGT